MAMTMERPMAASAAAMAMMNRAKIWPVAGSGAENLLNAMKLSDAPTRIISPAISMPIRVRRVTRP